MVKVNYDFYDSKDKYSDGEIEYEIVDNIKKYKRNYDEILRDNMNWNYYYYFSEARSNVYKIYPFKENCSILEVGAGMGAITSELCKCAKKVTSVELSKVRASAIYERNSDQDNLDIIVGNFENIKFSEKYDYVILNGVFEYSALYIHTENPYEDFINKLKKLLNKDGKILIAIENKNGIKYWCGALEDHTGIVYDGLRNYSNIKGVRTFSKNELENIINNCGLTSNFYYLFPDYKFPQILYTDESLDKNIFANYTPYYFPYTKTFFSEVDKYREIYENKCIPFFANSYLVELSEKKEEKFTEFAKFNNYRNNETNIVTFEKNNSFYKKNLFCEGNNFINRILHINNKLLDNKLLAANIELDNGVLKIEQLSGINVNSIIREYCKNGKFDECVKEIDCVIEKVYNKLQIQKNISNTIFEKFNIKINSNLKKSLHFIKDGFIDLSFNNMIKKDNDYYIFDQEWFLENVPKEYILYRAIMNFDNDNSEFNIAHKLYEHYNITSYLKEFKKIDQGFYKDVVNINDELISKNFVINYHMIDNMNEMVKSIDEVKDLSSKLLSEQQRNTELERIVESNKPIIDDYFNIINSRRWKLVNKIFSNKKK